MQTLGDLVTRIRQGGRWYRAISGFGPTKARALEQFVKGLLGPNVFSQGPLWTVRTDVTSGDLAGRTGANRLPALPGGIEASDDRAAIESWLAARATSAETHRCFMREAERFMLFCIVERQVALSAASTDDCSAYKQFLEAIPNRWIARVGCKRYAAGWAPFKGQLSTASRQHALTIISSLFKWLVDGHYLARNPWHVVNRHLGQGREVMARTASRALPPDVWDRLLAYLNEQEPTLSNERLRWICVFVRVTGLRADELVHATAGDLVDIDGRCFLQVYGKRRKQRFVPVPTIGLQALNRYLTSRGVTLSGLASPTPLLVTLDDNDTGMTTRGLAYTFTRFLRRALKYSTLSEKDQLHARKISLHWLRHTYETVAVERGMPLDVLQANLGQESPVTTARYYRAQEKRRGSVTEEVFSKI